MDYDTPTAVGPPTAPDAQPDPTPSFEDLVYRHRGAYRTLRESVSNETTRTLLELLVENDGNGVTYDMVLAYVDVTRRTVKQRVYALRDEGIVEVVDSGIALVGFTERVFLALTSDVLNDYYQETFRR